MNLSFLVVPYDSGRREWRMGRGPNHLLRHGVASSLRAAGHDVAAQVIELEGELEPREVESSFALYRTLAARLSEAAREGALPIILSGNCGATLSAVAGVAGVAGDAGVLWLDAHGDFNTPASSPSGFLDGMSLAIATGRCWRDEAEKIPGWTPVPERLVVHGAGRAFDAPEVRDLFASDACVVTAEALRASGVEGALVPALDALATRTRRLHLHIDLDALDASSVGRANHFAVDGGLTGEQLLETIRAAASRFTITSATFSSYDPDYDADGGVFRAALAAMEELAST